MAEVIYLTGAPATGKSTLGSRLSEHGITVFSYASYLLNHLHRQDRSLVHEDLRRESARRITTADIAQVDAEFARAVQGHSSEPIVIDSHPVTHEQYGFRVTPFTPQFLQALGITKILLLYCEPAVIMERLSNDPRGRRPQTAQQIARHIELQAAVATAYAVSLGCPLFAIDSAVSPAELLTTVAVDVLRIEGGVAERGKEGRVVIRQEDQPVNAQAAPLLRDSASGERTSD